MLLENLRSKSQKIYRFFTKKRITLFYIGLITVGLFMLYYAFWLQQKYSNPPSKHIDPFLEGFSLIQNETGIKMINLYVAVNLEPPLLGFGYYFEIEKNGTYIILINFPFRISHVNDIHFFPISAEYQVINNRTHGSSLLVRLVKESYERVVEGISGDFSVEETFVSGQRGEYLINLRFASEAAGSAYMDKIMRALGLNFTEFITYYQLLGYANATKVKNFMLLFIYPDRLTITHTSPQFTIGPFQWPSSNSTTIGWFYEELDPRELSFLIYYKDNEEYAHYQLMLFSSGIWYGLSFSVILTGVFELTKALLLSPSKSNSLDKQNA